MVGAGNLVGQHVYIYKEESSLRLQRWFCNFCKPSCLCYLLRGHLRVILLHVLLLRQWVMALTGWEEQL